MSRHPQGPRPRFKGVKLYSHDRGVLTFWHPKEWHLEEVDPPAIGVTLWPQPADPLTHLVVEAKDLEKPLADGEAELLETGIREGLRGLDDCTLESWRELSEEEPGEWGVEWQCAFSLMKARRVRQARMFVQDRYLYTVTFQGSSQERFRYWLGMFEFVMLTVATAHFHLEDRTETEGVKEAEPCLA